MKYPIEIIPKRSYKIINCNLNGFYLARTFEPNDSLGIIDKSTGFINIIYIANPTHRIVDMSTNLLGHFKPEYNKIKIKDSKFLKAWIPNDKVVIPQFMDDFLINEDILFWILQVNDNLVTKIPIDGQVNMDLCCKIVHTPNLSNFWHFSINWSFPSDNIEYLNVKDTKNSLGRRIANAAKSHIMINAKLGEFGKSFSQLEKKEFKFSRLNLFFRRIVNLPFQKLSNPKKSIAFL